MVVGGWWCLISSFFSAPIEKLLGKGGKRGVKPQKKIEGPQKKLGHAKTFTDYCPNSTLKFLKFHNSGGRLAFFPLLQAPMAFDE